MMYLVFSDIHSNIEALHVLLRWTKRKKIDRYLVLGDLVGYAASPNPVVDRIRKLRPLEIIRGNHDKVVSGVDDGHDFNSAAMHAASWTREKLNKANLTFLYELPQGPRLVEEQFLICHGSPFHEDAYMFTEYDAFMAFSSFKENLCFFGHTHVPRAYILHPDDRIETVTFRGDGGKLTLKQGLRYLINPGSLGQPRDRDPRISFATYDGERRVFTLHRKDYLLHETQAKIEKAALPRILAQRLSVGI